jgi:hypothetical protein
MILNPLRIETILESGHWRNITLRQSTLLQTGAITVIELVVENTIDRNFWRAKYLRYNTLEFPGLAQNVIFHEVKPVPDERYEAVDKA